MPRNNQSGSSPPDYLRDLVKVTIDVGEDLNKKLIKKKTKQAVNLFKEKGGIKTKDMRFAIEEYMKAHPDSHLLSPEELIRKSLSYMTRDIPGNGKFLCDNCGNGNGSSKKTHNGNGKEKNMADSQRHSVHNGPVINIHANEFKGTGVKTKDIYGDVTKNVYKELKIPDLLTSIENKLNIPENALPDGYRTDILTEVKNLQAEITKPEPDNTAIKSGLSLTRDILVRAMAGAAGGAIAKHWREIAETLRHITNSLM